MKFKKGDRLYLKTELLSKIKKEKPWLYKFSYFYQINFFGVDIQSNEICLVSFKRTRHDQSALYYFTVAAVEQYFTKTSPSLINLKRYV